MVSTGGIIVFTVCFWYFVGFGRMIKALVLSTVGLAFYMLLIALVKAIGEVLDDLFY